MFLICTKLRNSRERFDKEIPIRNTHSLFEWVSLLSNKFRMWLWQSNFLSSMSWSDHKTRRKFHGNRPPDPVFAHVLNKQAEDKQSENSLREIEYNRLLRLKEIEKGIGHQNNAQHTDLERLLYSLYMFVDRFLHTHTRQKLRFCKSYEWWEMFRMRYKYVRHICRYNICRRGYNNIARETALANSGIYKSEECLPKWARNNSSLRARRNTRLPSAPYLTALPAYINLSGATCKYVIANMLNNAVTWCFCGETKKKKGLLSILYIARLSICRDLHLGMKTKRENCFLSCFSDLWKTICSKKFLRYISWGVGEKTWNNFLNK